MRGERRGWERRRNDERVGNLLEVQEEEGEEEEAEDGEEEDEIPTAIGPDEG